ncbi:hypothetical protein C5167_016018 [Papaver somniferum]|nr:hypothetical protein C5167_016018 [Papaver somniferum]
MESAWIGDFGEILFGEAIHYLHLSNDPDLSRVLEASETYRKMREVAEECWEGRVEPKTMKWNDERDLRLCQVPD